MVKTERLLCVGGEADGVTVVISHRQSWVRVPCRPRQRTDDANPLRAPEFAPEASTGYERQLWRCGEHVRYVLVPPGQSPVETMDILLKGHANERS
jgi:hypothetical protein